MIFALHPAFHADWLGVRRGGGAALLRMTGGPALLLAGCVALACGDLYGSFGWCSVAAGLLAFGGAYAMARGRLLDALLRWHFGWCGAVPGKPFATPWTLFLLTGTVLTTSIVAVVVMLLIVSAPAPHPEDMPYALAGIGLGLIAGVVGAAVRVSRPGVLAQSRHVDGIREPLLALPWLNDARLPHLLDWQRRAALVRWRRGGSFFWVGIVLAVLPHGAPLYVVAAIVLLVLSLAWLVVAIRACADATATAVRLLGAIPLDTRRARVVSLRYPLVAMLCALALMIVGTELGGRWVIAAVWCVGAVAISGWPLRRIFKLTRQPGPST